MGMKTSPVRIILAITVIAGMAVFSACAKKPPADGGSPSAVAASSGAPAAAEKKHIEAFGTVKAKTVRAIYFDFPAVLEKKLVTEGQRVKRGDTLFLFSNIAYESQIKNKSYELTMAQYELKKSALELARLREDLEIAGQDTEKARRDLENKEKMLSIGAAAQSEVEDFKKRLTSEEQKKRGIERSIESFTSGEVNAMEVQRSRISIQENELQELQKQSKRSFISGNAVVSDVADGIVFEIGYTEGDYIGKDKKLCGLLDLDSLIVEANIPEEFAKDAKVGSKADIVPVADTSITYTGTVSRISSLAVKSGGETVIPVEISIDGKDGFLLPNFNVDVKIY
jgi:multidrug resistance efflux pump